MKKRISILGSTGSIGVNALSVVDQLNDQFEVVALSANTQWEVLAKQTNRLHPKTICLADETHIEELKNAVGNDVEILFGRSGLLELAGRNNVDLILNGLVGSIGMEPTFRAVTAGVNVALSNKESLVVAGSIITMAAKKTQANVYPVDSEHSAIWQCLQGETKDDIRRIILTGSGGPFRARPSDTFENVTVQEALRHPNWDMGNKITIDSATMMNKGLEVIEAYWLFELAVAQIDIVVHPQSIIHSMIEFNDSSIKAQLGVPDMKVPIQYAMTYPQHVQANWERLDLAEISTLTFEKPDYQRFPCIQLAYDALNMAGSAPAVLTMANDYAVADFLRGKIGFMDIPRLIATAVEKHNYISDPSMEDVLALEKWVQTMMQKGELK